MKFLAKDSLSWPRFVYEGKSLRMTKQVSTDIRNILTHGFKMAFTTLAFSILVKKTMMITMRKYLSLPILPVDQVHNRLGLWEGGHFNADISEKTHIEHN